MRKTRRLTVKNDDGFDEFLSDPKVSVAHNSTNLYKEGTIWVRQQHVNRT